MRNMDILLTVFSVSRDMGTILPASAMIWARKLPTASQGEAASLPLPTVDPTVCVTNVKTFDSWNADLAARTSLI